MATLILTAVGTAIGGPLGGAIGAILGQQVDQAAFRPAARRGPRLGDLAVQTSTYGSEIPKVFGRMRVAGTVVWATDLTESRSTSSGGKGRPKTVNYSYSANFAVALSGRPIIGVRRIWADGKLLRGAAGDFKSATVYRLYNGDEDQDVDPLIAAAQGVDHAPALRGTAYAVFENFELADYGNRIPSLTFEVEADDVVTIGDIAEELSNGAISAAGTPALIGYAAIGDSVRGAIEGLIDVASLSLSDRDGLLRLDSGSPAPSPIGPDEVASGRQTIRRADDAVADEVGITYYEVARDYQSGLQRATLGAVPRRAERVALPVALMAESVKAIAEQRLAMLRSGREQVKVSLSWSRSALRPGDIVSMPDMAGRWRVRRWTLEATGLALELARTREESASSSSPAAPGSGVGEQDLPHGPTTFHVIDLPLGEPAGGQPLLLVVAAGAQEGWRRANLIVSFDNNASWQSAGSTAHPAILGRAQSALATGDPALFDTVSALDVELLAGSMWLESADDDRLVAGTNLALVGEELIQFGSAQWLGDRRFRLTRLLRGRRGTESAVTGHEVDERFVLIERDSLAAISAPEEAIGSEAQFRASGIGDAVPVSASLTITGSSVRPPPPVHLRAARTPVGDIKIEWVRRSRIGWTWADAADTPLGEEQEMYRLTLAAGQRVVITSVASHIYTLDQQIEDGFEASPDIAVSQLGTHAESSSVSLRLD